MEFALTAPLLFSMILGTIEYGFVFYGYGAMQIGANQAARSIAVNKGTVGEASAMVADMLPGWMSGAVTKADIKNPDVPLQAQVEVEVTAPAGGTTPIHLFTSAFPFTLKTTVAVKRELPYEN